RRALDHHHSGGFFHHTEHALVSARIAAYGTKRVLGEIAAGGTGVDACGDSGESRREALGTFLGLLQKVKWEPLPRLLADPRKAGELGDQLVDCSHRPQSAASGFGDSFRISACTRSAARRCASAIAPMIRSASNSWSRPSNACGSMVKERTCPRPSTF